MPDGGSSATAPTLGIPRVAGGECHAEQMLNGYGWCVLRAEQPDPADSFGMDLSNDERHDAMNTAMWAEFRVWLDQHDDSLLRWDFVERWNNAEGVLTFSVSRNHRASVVWEMLEWIASRGRGSYGLFYAHDSEDIPSVNRYGRGQADHSNEFRVHRLLHGEITELPDPFFGPNLRGLESP